MAKAICETWKYIDGSDNAFVSDQGRVIRNGKLAIVQKDAEGYLRCTVGGSVGRDRVHRLVAKAFLDPVEGKKQVGHKNNKKNDNRVANLEWTTARENSLCAGRDGLLSHGGLKRRVLAYNVNTGESNIYESQSAAAASIGCSDSEVNKALRGKRQTCHGYAFYYL